jgi:nitrate/nitrite transport system substrate-binding protein
MKELGYTPPAATYAKYTIMGKPFDPAAPEAYVKSFKIAKA